MNSAVKSGFLNIIFCKDESIHSDYDFRSPSYQQITDSLGRTGYITYNRQTGIESQYSGGFIITSGDPILTFSEAGRIPLSIVSGHFNGGSKYKMIGDSPTGDWTAFIVFKHLETGDFVNSKVLFATKDSVSAASGYVVGINGCNRLFFEHPTPLSGNRIYTLNEELDNKSVISVAKIDNSLSIGFHQFEDFLNKTSANVKFNMSDYRASSRVFIGGLGASGQGYKNFSGYIDEFMLFNVGLEFPERNSFAKAFFCSGFSTGELVPVATTYTAVTGLELRQTVVATGISGLYPTGIGTETVDGGTVQIYGLTGAVGSLYDSVAVELTGVITGQSFVFQQRPASGIPNYSYISEFGSSRVVLLNNFDQSFKEIYSFSGKNTDDINLIPAFSDADLTYTVFPTGTGEVINFYVNGLLMPNQSQFSSTMSGEFVHTGNLIDSDGFYDLNDLSIYDIISGQFSLTGITTGEVFSGSKTITKSYVADRDLYLNGQKLVSGVDYSGVSTNVTISTSNLVDGDLCLIPKHLSNLNRYTGSGDNNFDTNIFLYDEQIWVNGLRQIRETDYIKVPNFSLKYSTFSLDPFPDQIYNNDESFYLSSVGNVGNVGNISNGGNI
jgi:hypothetical protein